MSSDASAFFTPRYHEINEIVRGKNYHADDATVST